MRIMGATQLNNAISIGAYLIQKCIITGSCVNSGIRNNYSIKDNIVSDNLINLTAGTSGIYTAGTKVSTIKNNKILGNVATGIVATNESLILGNYIRGQKTNGIDFIPAVGTYKSTIRGNDIDITPIAASQSTAILLRNEISGDVIDNKINLPGASNYSVAIQIYDGDCTVSGNKITKAFPAAGTNFIVLIAVTKDKARTINFINNIVKATAGNSSSMVVIGTDVADGNDGNNTVAVVVKENKIIGRWDEVSEDFNHALLVGYQKDADVKYNLFDHSGVIVMEGGLGTIINTTNGFHHNLIVDHSKGIVAGGWDNLFIVNNTIISKHLPPQAAITVTESNNGADTNDCNIKNNIVVCSASGTFTAIELAHSVDEVIDYNIYYAAGTLQFKRGLTSYNFAQWKALGYDTHSVVLTTEQFNGLFTDFANGDYALAAGSAAEGTGNNLGDSYNVKLSPLTNWGTDIELPTVVTELQGENWNIGAY